MRGKTQLKNAVDGLKENNVVVAGVSVEHNAIRCMCAADDDEARKAIDDIATNHIADVAHEATEDGTAVFQIINKEELDF